VGLETTQGECDCGAHFVVDQEEGSMGEKDEENPRDCSLRKRQIATDDDEKEGTMECSKAKGNIEEAR
jgi:hypothetical protein